MNVFAKYDFLPDLSEGERTLYKSESSMDLLTTGTDARGTDIALSR